MPFEFISSAEDVARQQQLWGVIIGSVGLLLLGFAQYKGRPLVLSLIGVALIAVGGYYLFQAWQPGQTAGKWVIRVDSRQISWSSPNESVDQSFTVNFNDIAFIDRSAKSSPTDDRSVYHIVLADESAIMLKDISGIDLDQFIKYLEAAGLETRETGKYAERPELRNK
jgi:hypothetical protein